MPVTAGVWLHCAGKACAACPFEAPALSAVQHDVRLLRQPSSGERKREERGASRALCSGLQRPGPAQHIQQGRAYNEYGAEIGRGQVWIQWHTHFQICTLYVLSLRPDECPSLTTSVQL